MLDDWWKKAYPYLFKKPCNTCLTLATCQNKQPWQRTCETKTEWRSKEYKVETFLNNVECVFAVSIFILGCVLMIATFFLGFWKWYDIGRMLFS
jgi:hypothetical protein